MSEPTVTGQCFSILSDFIRCVEAKITFYNPIYIVLISAQTRQFSKRTGRLKGRIRYLNWGSDIRCCSMSNAAFYQQQTCIQIN